MARVTVEDCVEKVENRFQLVMLAAQRSREISDSKGYEITVPADNDKPPVIALREIAAETVALDVLEEGLVSGQQRQWREEREPGEEEGASSTDRPALPPAGDDFDPTAWLKAHESETEELPPREGG